MSETAFRLEELRGVRVLRLRSQDETNRLTRDLVLALTETICQAALEPRPLVITGNGLTAYEFSIMGQELMRVVDEFPAPVYAAVSGYCMGGGLDLALACHHRIGSPHSVFGHRGAALGLITGWGGTQRLPRLLGKGRALEMFVAAEKVTAVRAIEIGLIDGIADDPVAAAIRRIEQ
jgi:enoyl-CoA hydratase/carnithine racemase